MTVYIETLPAATKKLFQQLFRLPSLKQFYLSGGTALALHIGHRESEDLDFFTSENFLPTTIQQELLVFGSPEDVKIDEGTLNAFLEEVKLQFLYYPYQLLEKPTIIQGIQISSIIDIACTKLITISARGSKKDFIDLYFILKSYSLEELFKKLDEKYHGIEYNTAHILKSLVYFTDADGQPMPKMHMPVDWESVKMTIKQKIKAVTF